MSAEIAGYIVGEVEAGPFGDGWGEFWGCDDDHESYTAPGQRPCGVPMWMRRKGSKVRFFSADGRSVGPLHANVVPAMIWAAGSGWVDPYNVAGSIAMNVEVRQESRRFNERSPEAGRWEPMPTPAEAAS